MLRGVFADLIKAEQVEEVADGRRIVRHIRIGRAYLRVGHVVPAEGGHRTEIPVPLDELEDGNVIRIVVRDVSCAGVGRYNHERNPGTVAEVVERLNVAGVVITAA